MILVTVVDLLFKAIYLMMFARVLLSWVPNVPHHPIVDFIYQVTDPILEPFQRLMPRGMGIDFSPILAFLALQVARNIIMGFLV